MTYPRCCDRGGFRFFSGTVSEKPVPPASGAWVDLAEHGMASQARAVYLDIEAQMSDAGGIGNLMRLHLFQHDKRQFPVLETVRLELEGATPAPSSGIEVAWTRSFPPRWIEIDGIGLNPSGVERYGARSSIAAGAAGASASHYSQASIAGPYAFFAGMIPIDPHTRKVVNAFEDVEPEGRWLQRGRSHPDSRIGPIAAQTWSLYRRIIAAVEELGGSAEDICSATVFLSRAGDCADFLRVHQYFFPESGPTLQIACVDEVGHEGTLIEIECTAAPGMAISRWRSETGDGRESPDVVCCGELAFLGDCLGLDGDGLPALAAEGGDRKAASLLLQGELAFERLAANLAGAGLDPAQVGHLWLKVRRGSDHGALARLVGNQAGFAGAAVTISEADGLPQSELAEISISAVCAGVEEN